MDLRHVGRISAIAAGLCFLAASHASAGWSRAYGGNGSEEARAVRQTSDGGYIVAGMTNSFGAGGTDVWVLKLDGGGNVQWEKTFGGAGNEAASSVRQTSDGGYVVAGETGSFGAGGQDMWVIKLSATGTVQWEKALGGFLGNEVAFSIREKPTGGYVVAGQTDDFMGVTQPPDVLVVELDSLGNISWQNVYGGMTDMQSEGRALALTDDDADGVRDDGLIVAGLRLAQFGTDFDFWVVKTDSVGTVQWEQFFDSGLPLVNGDVAYWVDQTSDGGFVVAGETPSNNADFWIVKLDSTGLVQWQTSHGSASGDAAFGVEQTTDGGYITAGFTTVNNNDAFLVKLSSTGAVQWQKAYGGSSTDQARAIQQTVDGGFIVAGFTDSFGVGRDLWVYKTDGNGDLDASCSLVTTTSFMLTNTGLASGNAIASSSPASASASSSTATVADSTLSRTTQCAGPSQQSTRVTQAINGNHEQECSIAIDPTNFANQAIVYMEDPAVAGPVRFPSLGVSYTTDGGVGWTDSQIRFGCDGIDDDVDGFTDEEVNCDGQDDDFDGLIDEDLCCNLVHIDPSIAADRSGNLFAAFIAYEPNASINFMGSAYVVAATSVDRGATWTTYAPLDQSVFTPPGTPVDFLDKCWLSVDTDVASPRTGTAYVAWQRDSTNGTNSNVWISSLGPGAPMWSMPVQVNDPPQNCADAPYPVQGPAGDLWVIWRHSTTVCGGQGQFWLDRSMDGGQTWAAQDIAGATYTPIPQTLYGHTNRTSDFPFLSIDPANPNALYVVYSADPGAVDQANIAFQRSLDGGQTWIAPSAVTVNDDVTNEPQYFPVVRAKLNTFGQTLVDVMWLDERSNVGCRVDDDLDGLIDEEIADGIDNDGDFLIDEDLCDIRIDVYFSRSVNAQSGSPTFSPNVRVTSMSFGTPSVPPDFLGDYVDFLPAGSIDYAAWADTRSGDNDVYWSLIPDIDSDGDAVTDFGDCSPADSTVFAPPGVVQSVTVTGKTNPSVAWTSQDPATGTGTVYDIVSGLVSELTADGNFSRASCLIDNHGNTPYVDMRAAPPSNDAYYYLIRAHNSCAIGSFGATGPSDPRTALDGTTPCAF